MAEGEGKRGEERGEERRGEERRREGGQMELRRALVWYSQQTTVGQSCDTLKIIWLTRLFKW